MPGHEDQGPDGTAHQENGGRIACGRGGACGESQSTDSEVGSAEGENTSSEGRAESHTALASSVQIQVFVCARCILRNFWLRQQCSAV